MKEFDFIKLQDQIFRELFEAAENDKFTPDERDAYENSLKYYRDFKNVVDTAREEGRKEGREEAREERRKKGREERSVEIAKKMKLRGIPTEEIVEFTGLDKAQIEGL